MLPGPAVPGCCWISLHFLWGKLSTRTVPSYYKRFNTGKGEILPCVGCNQLPFRVTLSVVTMHTFLDKNRSLFLRMESPHTPKTTLTIQYSCTKASRLTLTSKEDPNTAGKGNNFNFLCCKIFKLYFLVQTVCNWAFILPWGAVFH